MTTKTKLVIGLLLICLLGLIAWLVLGSGGDDAPPPDVIEEPPDAPEPEEGEGKRRRRVDEAGARADDEEAADENAEEIVSEPILSMPFVRVVDGPGADAGWVADASVRVAWGGGWVSDEATDERGIVRLIRPAGTAGDVTVIATAAGRGTTRVILPASFGQETRIVMETAHPLRLSFVDSVTGREFSAAEVERIYADRGRQPTAELVWESALLADGGPGAMFEEWMTNGEEWRVHAPVRREGDDWMIDAAPAAGAAPPSAVLVVDPYGQLLAVRVQQSADGRLGDGVVRIEPAEVLIRLRLVDGESRAPLPGATVWTFHQFGDDRAYARGPTSHADGNGIIELPLASKIGDANRRKTPTYWVVTDTHVAEIRSYNVRNAEPGALLVTVHPFVASQDPDRSAIGRSRGCGRAAGRGSAGDGRGPSGLDRGAGASRSEASAPHRRARVASEA